MKKEIIDYIIEAFEMDIESAEEIFKEYISTIRENAKKLVKSLEAADFKAAVMAVHTIKGCSLNCHNTPMSEAAIAADAAAKRNDFETFKTLSSKVLEIADKLSEI